MGIKRDNTGKKGDVWKFYLQGGTHFSDITEYHLLLEYLNEAIRYPGDPPRYYWKTYNLGNGIFEEIGIDYNNKNWTKVG